MKFVLRWLDVIFLFTFLGTYIYLTIFRKSSALRIFLYFCILWSTSEIWIVLIPNYDRLFSDLSPFPGATIPFLGLIYGVPLTMISFITWRVKKKREGVKR